MKTDASVLLLLITGARTAGDGLSFLHTVAQSLKNQWSRSVSFRVVWGETVLNIDAAGIRPARDDDPDAGKGIVSDFDSRLVLHGAGDEMQVFADAAAQLFAEKVDARETAVREAACAAIRVLGINYHKLRNVLGGISGLVQLSQIEAGSNEEIQNNLREILKVISDYDRESRNVMSLYRNEAFLMESGTCSVPSALRRKVGRTARVFSLSGVELIEDIAADVYLPVSEAVWNEMVDILLSNAFESFGDAKKGGRIHLSCSVREGTLVLTVRDSGQGIPYLVQKDIFAPFFTTKYKRRGTGLFVLKRYVQSLRGNIAFSSEPGRGAQFTVEFPIDE
ncbi:MAG: ATP-binding protein [Fibrobacterota bacterium]